MEIKQFWRGQEAAWYTVKQLDQEGKIIHLDHAKMGEPEWRKEIRREFSDLETYRSDEDEMEDFLSYLEDEVVEEEQHGFSMPLPNSTTEYIISFNDKILLYFLLSDEYMGFGDSESYVHLDSIMVPEGTPIEEVREVKEWLIKGGFKKRA